MREIWSRGVPGPKGVPGQFGGAWFGGVPGLGGGVPAPGGEPPRMATAVGGTHPAGMHSCCISCYLCKRYPV